VFIAGLRIIGLNVGLEVNADRFRMPVFIKADAIVAAFAGGANPIRKVLE
jgi:hypothetical protein